MSADPVLREALQRQFLAVTRATERLESAAAALGRPLDTSGWLGPARWAYDAAFGRLRGSVGVAADILAAARSETARALATVGERVR